MKILIVDGNEKQASDNYTNLGMDTQFEVYSKIIKKVSKLNVETIIIHPAIYDNFLPEGLNLDDFDGVAWTGSVLNIYDQTPAILRQIELAKLLFQKSIKIFGSCWGLQVLVTAAGGKVRKNPKGLEAIISREIKLNEQGQKHPMYFGKNKLFDSFCWHYDEAETLPEETEILASNEKSKIQSISFNRNDCKVWAVQYHPEFDPVWMSGLMQQREDILLDAGIYKNKNEFNSFKDYFSNIDYYSSKKEPLNISESLINQKIHTIELSNWVNSLNS